MCCWCLGSTMSAVKQQQKNKKHGTADTASQPSADGVSTVHSGPAHVSAGSFTTECVCRISSSVSSQLSQLEVDVFLPCCVPSVPHAVGVPYIHIDVLWLWPVRWLLNGCKGLKWRKLYSNQVCVCVCVRMSDYSCVTGSLNRNGSQVIARRHHLSWQVPFMPPVFTSSPENVLKPFKTFVVIYDFWLFQTRVLSGFSLMWSPWEEDKNGD